MVILLASVTAKCHVTPFELRTPMLPPKTHPPVSDKVTFIKFFLTLLTARQKKEIIKITNWNRIR